MKIASPENYRLYGMLPNTSYMTVVHRYVCRAGPIRVWDNIIVTI